MKCRYCGYDIPEGELYCENCGKEVQIVPDYNPLDDMLTAQIKVSLDGDEPQQDDFFDRTSTERRNVRNTGRNTGSSTKRGITQRTPEMERRRRKQQAAREKAALRKKRRRLLLIMALFLILTSSRLYI